jgi:hypothetical protein
MLPSVIGGPVKAGGVDLFAKEAHHLHCIGCELNYNSPD